MSINIKRPTLGELFTQLPPLPVPSVRNPWHASGRLWSAEQMQRYAVAFGNICFIQAEATITPPSFDELIAKWESGKVLDQYTHGQSRLTLRLAVEELESVIAGPTPLPVPPPLPKRDKDSDTRPMSDAAFNMALEEAVDKWLPWIRESTKRTRLPEDSFTAADMMDARRDERERLQSEGMFTAADMMDARRDERERLNQPIVATDESDGTVYRWIWGDKTRLVVMHEVAVPIKSTRL